MTKETLKKWAEDWSEVTEIILFGNGKTCKYHIEELRKNFSIKYILDNDKNKQRMIGDYGIPVKSVLDVENELKISKVVVFSAYEEVSKQLKELGLEEYKDFCDYRLFVTGWNWFKYKEIHLSEVHVALTTKCTLNCQNCNMFIPNHNHKHTGAHVSLEQLKKDFDLLFSKVNKICRVSLVGGEPFLYPHLKEIIEYLTVKYKEQFNQIEIYTNATVPMKKDMCLFLKEHKVTITVSNYSNLGNPYVEKVRSFVEILEKNSVSYVENISTEWLDFQFPNSPFYLSDEKAIENMLLCNPGFRGFNDGKFYFCHIVWSAVLCHALEDNKDDYLDFHAIRDEEEIVFYHLGIMDGKFVSLCKYCAGCSTLYRKSIPAAIQEKMEK